MLGREVPTLLQPQRKVSANMKLFVFASPSYRLLFVVWSTTVGVGVVAEDQLGVRIKSAQCRATCLNKVCIPLTSPLKMNPCLLNAFLFIIAGVLFYELLEGFLYATGRHRRTPMSFPITTRVKSEKQLNHISFFFSIFRN